MTKKDWWQRYDDRFGQILFQESKIYKPSDQLTRQEVELILRATKPKRSAVFLDIACGVGRHSHFLARRGFDVIGLDYSTHYIAIAKREAKRLGVSSRAHFIYADMRCLSDHVKPASIDIALCLWNSFGVFKSRSDDLRVLKQVAEAVKPNGLFLLSTFHHSGVRYKNHELPQKMGSDARYRWIEYRPKRFFLEKAHFDSKRSLFLTEYHLVDLHEGTHHIYPTRTNVYTHKKLTRMLNAVGFSLVCAWGSRTGGKLTSRSFTQTLLAKKDHVVPGT